MNREKMQELINGSDIKRTVELSDEIAKMLDGEIVIDCLMALLLQMMELTNEYGLDFNEMLDDLQIVLCQQEMEKD